MMKSSSLDKEGLNSDGFFSACMGVAEEPDFSMKEAWGEVSFFLFLLYACLW